MSKTEPYRSQDVVLEAIKAMHAGAPLSWNESCEKIADAYAASGLPKSAAAALTHLTVEGSCNGEK